MSKGKIVLIAILALLVAGCVGGYRMLHPASMRVLESALQDSYPELRFESSIRFSLGGLLLDFVDFAFVHQPELDISKLSHAEVGIYKLEGQTSLGNFEIPTQAFDSRHCPTWDLIARVREDDEQVHMIACIKQEKVTAISIFVLAPEEMVIVNARGDFDGLLNSLLKVTTESSPRVAAAFHGDLY